jgi:hypothetical protein
VAGEELDLTGYAIAAVDGDIGHVDESTNELLGASYLVVDTGPWIFGRKVLLPAGVVERIDTAQKKVYVAGRRIRSRTHRSTTNSPTTPPTVSVWGATTHAPTTAPGIGCEPGRCRRFAPVRI